MPRERGRIEMNDEFRQNCEDLRLVIYHLNEIALSYAADAERFSLESDEWSKLCESYETEIRALKEKIKTQEAQLGHLANTQKILDETLKELAEDRRKFDAEKIALETDYQQKNATLENEYQQKNAAWQSQKESDERELQRQREEVAGEKQKAIEAQNTAINAKNAADELYRNYREKIDSYDNLLNEKISAQDNFNAEKSRADSLQSELDAANKKISELEGNIERLTEAIKQQAEQPAPENPPAESQQQTENLDDNQQTEQPAPENLSAENPQQAENPQPDDNNPPSNWINN